MELPIPKAVQTLWDTWNLRSGILLSLGLQIFLMLSAERRQRSKSAVLRGFIWMAYLVSDWIATIAIGLITKTQGKSCKGAAAANIEDDFLAFWAAFLLVHLGGPDTITSFALEDNEFWLRHLVGLILQVLLAAYSLFLTLPLARNRLWLPTVLVFLVGIVKFSERTFALYLASTDHFAETVLPAPDPGIDYEEAVEVYTTMRSETVLAHPEKSWNYCFKEPEASKDVENRPISEEREIELMGEAHSNFQRFKGLIAGFLVSSKRRQMSRRSFLEKSPNEAFRLIEYELSFIYQVLHTKVIVVRRRVGYVLRVAIFFSMLTASSLFYLADKRRVARSNLALTYALLAAAVTLEASSLFNLVFSKWTWISVKDTNWRKLVAKRALALRGLSRWVGWSWSISQYDAISYFLDERPAWLYKLAGFLNAKPILELIKIWLHADSVALSPSVKNFVVMELRTKSIAASSLRAAEEACSQRGDWALLHISAYKDLQWSVGEFQYAESVLLWHIATQLCYEGKDDAVNEEEDVVNEEDDVVNEVNEVVNKEDDVAEKKLICKNLSDYMFWLLVARPAILAPVLENWHITFQDTCAEAKRFFAKHRVRDRGEACLRVDKTGNLNYRPSAVKGNMSRSVLFDATHLANKLRVLKMDKWGLMSRVWVELLSYAAINCRPIVHAQQPSQGGELLTFVWLLMNHLGLGTQFYEQEQQAGTKLAPTK